MITAALILWAFGFVVTGAFFVTEPIFANRALNAVAAVIVAALLGWAIVPACYGYWAFIHLAMWHARRAEVYPRHH